MENLHNLDNDKEILKWTNAVKENVSSRNDIDSIIICGKLLKDFRIPFSDFKISTVYKRILKTCENKKLLREISLINEDDDYLDDSDVVDDELMTLMKI